MKTKPILALALAAGLLASGPSIAEVDTDTVNPPPTAKDWAAIAKLPDWSGVWMPDIPDQNRQMRTNPTPWTPEAAKRIEAQRVRERAGDPTPLFTNCLPEAMPAWMLISHNSMEILFTPGRVTMLGESDGNRLRRIYTDGRKAPADPDPTFHGYSVGHWEGDTLVIETTGILPQSLLAISEGVGIPIGEGAKVVERIRLAEPDSLHDELTITAPAILTEPWKTTRIFGRHRTRAYDIIEGVCIQGNLRPVIDENGIPGFEPVEFDAGGSPTAQ